MPDAAAARKESMAKTVSKIGFVCSKQIVAEKLKKLTRLGFITVHQYKIVFMNDIRFAHGLRSRFLSSH